MKPPPPEKCQPVQHSEGAADAASVDVVAADAAAAVAEGAGRSTAGAAASAATKQCMTSPGASLFPSQYFTARAIAFTMDERFLQYTKKNNKARNVK